MNQKKSLDCRIALAAPVLVICLLLHPVPAASEDEIPGWQKDFGGSNPFYPFEHEYDDLPAYCRVKANEQQRAKYPELWKKWQEAMGPYRGWIDVHHYCAGLLELLRLSKGLGKRETLLGDAERQFQYMINTSDPRFPLMPEILLKMGELQIEMGKDEHAVGYLMKSIKLKPRYALPYIKLAEIQLRQGVASEAISLLKLGISVGADPDLLGAKLQAIEGRSGDK